MTREERIEKLRHLITCMKCEVRGKVCDNCPTQYDAGNKGEIIENLEEIAKALEQDPVLSKIKAEIEQLPTEKCTETCRISIDADVFKENVLAILDNYQAESEGK